MSLALAKKNTIATVLIDYRCACGKLLFKGLLLSSALEIKCKRCGQIRSVGDTADNPDGDDYSMLFDEATNIIDASPSASTVLGYSREQLRSRNGKKSHFLFKMDTYYKLWQTARRLNFSSFTFETVHLKQSGEPLAVSADVRFIKNDDKTLAFVMFKPLAVARDTLAPALERTRSLTDFPSECIAEVNGIGQYTYVSRLVASRIAYAAEELLGKTIFDFTLPAERERLQALFLHHRQHKRSFKIRPHTLIAKDGSACRFESCFITHFDDRGELRGYRIVSWPLAA